MARRDAQSRQDLTRTFTAREKPTGSSKNLAKVCAETKLRAQWRSESPHHRRPAFPEKVWADKSSTTVVEHTDRQVFGLVSIQEIEAIASCPDSYLPRLPSLRRPVP